MGVLVGGRGVFVGVGDPLVADAVGVDRRGVAVLVPTKIVRVGVDIGVPATVDVLDGVEVPADGEGVPDGVPFGFVAVALTRAVTDFTGVVVRLGGATYEGCSTADGIGTTDASGVAVSLTGIDVGTGVAESSSVWVMVGMVAGSTGVASLPPIAADEVFSGVRVARLNVRCAVGFERALTRTLRMPSR